MKFVSGWNTNQIICQVWFKVKGTSTTIICLKMQSAATTTKSNIITSINVYISLDFLIRNKKYQLWPTRKHMYLKVSPEWPDWDGQWHGWMIITLSYYRNNVVYISSRVFIINYTVSLEWPDWHGQWHSWVIMTLYYHRNSSLYIISLTEFTIFLTHENKYIIALNNCMSKYSGFMGDTFMKNIWVRKHKTSQHNAAWLDQPRSNMAALKQHCVGAAMYVAL